MLSFRSLADVEQANLPPRACRAVTRAVHTLFQAHPSYDPEADGFVVLVTPDTTPWHALELFGRPWHEAPIEGATVDRETGHYVLTILLNNQFVLTLLAPNEPWIDPGFRAQIEDAMDDGRLAS